MLYDTVKFQSDPAFSTLNSASYTQEGSGTAYVERNRKAVAAGASGTFLGSYNSETETITIGKGSYQYPIGTNTDVEAESGTGDFAYAVIKQDASGVLVEFKIEVSSTTKDPTNLDVANGFVEFSNVLLGEVMDVGDNKVFIQRRTGNLSLIHRLINGALCLWPETTGGTSL